MSYGNISHDVVQTRILMPRIYLCDCAIRIAKPDFFDELVTPFEVDLPLHRIKVAAKFSSLLAYLSFVLLVDIVAILDRYLRTSSSLTSVSNTATDLSFCTYKDAVFQPHFRMEHQREKIIIFIKKESNIFIVKVSLF